MTIRLSVQEVALARTPCRTRLPFRFGAVTVREAERITCRVLVRAAGGRVEAGWSGDLLVPRWFRKDTVATPQQDADELHASVVAAAGRYTAHGESTAFGTWRDVFAERVASLPFEAPDLLVRCFGVALVERAVLDAVSWLAGLPFAEALRRDAFGCRPGDVHAELADWRWQVDLPKPRNEITVRHTVGMLDVLRERDLAPEQRLGDGLPQTLEQDAATYGLSWLKVEVGAGFAADRARLCDLADFFAESRRMFGLTLDGNEQFEDLGQLADLLEAVAAEPRGHELLREVAWIEQPLARSAASTTCRRRSPPRRAGPTGISTGRSATVRRSRSSTAACRSARCATPAATATAAASQRRSTRSAGPSAHRRRRLRSGVARGLNTRPVPKVKIGHQSARFQP